MDRYYIALTPQIIFTTLGIRHGHGGVAKSGEHVPFVSLVLVEQVVL